MVEYGVLVEIIHDGKLLLKKATRGVSAGKWNGPGGHKEEGETPEQCAIREVLEETGLKIENPFYHGVLKFHMNGGNQLAWVGHLFSVREFSGKLLKVSDDGGALKWFPIEKLPYKEMWDDDVYWMPHMLKGDMFDADFYFGKGNKTVIRHEIRINASR